MRPISLQGKGVRVFERGCLQQYRQGLEAVLKRVREHGVSGRDVRISSRREGGCVVDRGWGGTGKASIYLIFRKASHLGGQSNLILEYDPPHRMESSDHLSVRVSLNKVSAI